MRRQKAAAAETDEDPVAFVSGPAVTFAWHLAVEGRVGAKWALMIALAAGIGTSLTWRTAAACRAKSVREK